MAFHRKIPTFKAILLLSLLFIAYLPASTLSISRNGSNLIGEHTSSSLAHGLRLDNAYLGFSPKKVIEKPFALSWEKDSRREHFFEYLFKSFFFGEFEFTDSELLVKIVIISGMLLAGILFFSLIMNLENLNPLALLLGAISLSALMYLRFRYPYSPCQDFRQITFSLPAVGYLLAKTKLEATAETLLIVLISINATAYIGIILWL